MGTVAQRIEHWRKWQLRGSSQVNDEVCLIWYNEWLHIFQKYLLEYVANQCHVNTVTAPTVANQDTYDFPFGQANIKDFYSIVQLRVAYKTNKDWNPIYHVVRPINLADYNIRSTWYQKWEPIIYRRISKKYPRYSFVWSDKFRLYPTPTESIPNGIILDFNFFNDDVWANTNESALDLPRYFLDVIENYLSYKLILNENPELAWIFYQEFENTLHDNIYWMNRDQRPIEEWFANLYGLSHR